MLEPTIPPGHRDTLELINTTNTEDRISEQTKASLQQNPEISPIGAEQLLLEYIGFVSQIDFQVPTLSSSPSMSARTMPQGAYTTMTYQPSHTT